MALTRAITEDDVILDIRAERLEEALDRILSLAQENGYLENKDEILREVLRKERVKPTILNGEVLVPHIASDEFKKEVVIFGRSRSGVPLDDETRVRYFFFVGVPKKKRSRMFDIISEISFAVKDKDFLANLRLARNIDDVLFAIQQKRMPLISKLRRKLARLQAAVT